MALIYLYFFCIKFFSYSKNNINSNIQLDTPLTPDEIDILRKSKALNLKSDQQQIQNIIFKKVMENNNTYKNIREF